MTTARWTILGSSPRTSLILQRGNRQRLLPAVRLRDIRPAGRLRPVSLPMDPIMQIREPRLEVCLVVLPRQSIHPGGGIPLERMECFPQVRDADVVQERCEPFLLPLPCGLPHAVQPLGHAFPVLCPARAVLSRLVRSSRPNPSAPPPRIKSGGRLFAPLAPPPVARLCSLASPL